MQRWLVLFALAASSCAWSSTHQYSLGPYEMDHAALYDRMVRTLTAEGYETVSADPARGTVIVQANFRHPSYPERHRFTVQCYREGWIQLTPSGPMVRRQNETLSMPRPLATEYQSLAIRLGAALRSTRSAS
jgi:hypothetical protein